MKNLTFLILFSFLSIVSLGQKRSTEIEILPFIRLDWYPQFKYVLNGRPSIDNVNIRGTSFGLSLAYKIPISKTLLIKPGLGYYRYSFNNIKKVNTVFGKSNERNINFISPLFIPFFSDKYSYNTIFANFGIEKVFDCKSNLQIRTGLDLKNYYVFSEYYHLSNNPNGNLDLLKKDKRYFGYSFLLNVSLIKQYKKISLGPSLILPLFDSWKKDSTFPEEINSGSRNKWLKGVGLGLSLNYLLSKNKK